MKFASWFCGIGGIDLGLERAGHRCVYACEIDPFARTVYAHRFGRWPEGGDITRVVADEIPYAELWVGGAPCQDLSTAGRRAGLGRGTRSGLIWAWLDLLEAKGSAGPTYWLYENVPGLLSSNHGEDFRTLLGALDELGFDAAWRVLDARYHGVPQRRRRVFLLASRRAGEGADPREVLLEPESVRGDLEAGCSPDAEVAGTLGGGSGSRGWCNDLDRSGAFVVGGRGAGDGRGGEQRRGGVVGFGPFGSVDEAHAVNTTNQRLDPTIETFVVGAFNSTAESGRGGNGWDERSSPPVKVGTEGGHAPPAIVIAINSRDEVRTMDISGCLPANPGAMKQQQFVAYAPEPAHTVQASAGHHGHSSPRGDGSDNLVAYRVNAAESCARVDHAKETDYARCLDGNGGFATNQGGTVVAQCHGGNVGPLGTLRAGDNVTAGVPFTPHPIAFTTKDRGQDAGAESPTLRAMGHAASRENGGGQVGVVHPSGVSLRSRDGAGTAEMREGEIPALRANQGGGDKSYVLDMVVRRLLPVECEKLQGLPPGWTDIPWNGQPTAPDSKRYKAIGNSVAVVVIEGIGRRLWMAVDERGGR